MSVWNKVNEFMDEVLSKNKEEMDMEKIEPFSEECKFGKNGIWLFIGPQGSGKTHKLIQTILYTEFYGEKPYFNNIIFSSTSDTLDKTLDAFRKKIKTKIEFVKQENLFDRLQSHIKRKTKFYSMMKYINSNGDIVDPTMKHIAEKHKLYTRPKTAKYLRKKMEDYGHPNYPANLLLILDDYLGSNLLEFKNSPIVMFLTKCRHFNITCIIAQQSTKGIGVIPKSPQIIVIFPKSPQNFTGILDSPIRNHVRMMAILVYIVLSLMLIYIVLDDINIIRSEYYKKKLI